MEGGGDTSSSTTGEIKKSSLPPPPILSNNTTSTMKPPTVSGNSTTNASGLSSLPPPPTLANGVGSGSVVTKNSKVSSKLPPPPQLTINPSGESNISTTSSTSQPKVSSNIHTVTENIPTLSSAPNSTQFTIPPQNQQSSYIDMHKVYPTAAAHNMKTATQQQQLSSSTTQSQQQSQQSAAQQHFAQQQQTSQTNNEQPPSSGNSWTAWAPSGTSALLEKAGQFAYTAAESAADLIVESASSPNSNIGPTTPGVTRENVASDALNMVDASPGVDNTSVQHGNVTAHEVSESGKTDNFANLFATQQEGQMTTAASSSINEEDEESRRKDDEDILLKGELSTPDNSSHPVTQPQQQSSQHPANQQQQQRRRFRAVSNPPTSILATRQKHLPVLILPTSDAREIATRNNTTLSELFTTYGNLRSSKTTAPEKIDKTLEPMLPPLRSANRSMALRWNDIILDFKLVEELDYMPVKESVMESGLDVSVRLWDEDITSTASGEEGSDKEERRDREMDQLEEYVVKAIREDEIDECIRKKDGIPSMSSELPSSLRNNNTTNQNEDTEEHQRGREPFPPSPEVQLQKASNTAFSTLTTNPTSTPYLKRFRHTLDYATNGMSHEMLTNPSVVILVASTSDYSYVNCLAELANVHHLPRPYHDGRYDPNGIRREFLLLHDVQSGPKEFNESSALVTMRERFGVGCCSILKINSLVPRQVAISDGVQNVGEDVEWENNGMQSPFVKDVLSSDYTTTLSSSSDVDIRGACLSPSDKRAIRRYVANMVATGLIPAVERRIAHLNATVTNAKKGVKNVIKSFWRKPKDNNILVNVSGYNDGENNNQTSGGDVGDQGGGGAASSAALSSSSNNNVKYRYDSIESQTRLLADTLFLMRDYEAALSSYRLVKDDYKHDKAHLHYASVQEMMVFCMYCLDPSGRDGRYAHDVHHSIETSLYSYTRASDEEKESDASSGITRPGKAPYATRLATRLCLAISASRSLCDGKHMEIADLLASASSHETPLGAAILLEQSSAQYYRAGMLRKYAFHMLMAGHMFRSASQERHAFRCFAASLYVYHGERWGELRSHLRSALAAQLYGMGRYALSMQFYAKLIGMLGGRVSVRSQQKFLNHIVNICKEYPSSALVAIDRMEQGDIDGEHSSRCVDDVLKSSSGDAVRQIELSNIGFPAVQDSSIGIRVSSASNSCVTLGHSDSLASEDGSGQGTESVWQDMMICAEAEVSSSISSSIVIDNNSNSDNPSSHDDSGPAVPLAHSGDALIDKVISSIDKEERDAEYRDRQKRKGGVRTAEVRATSEPLSVTFSLKNPLGLDIELKEMQLVASLSCPKSGKTHSNEFPLSTKDDAGTPKTSKSWTFHGSSHQFHSPEFMCQQSNDLNTPSSKPVNEEPYFVVTKPSMKMGPNSTTLVNLKICPLAEGDLRILGARFHLLEEVWVYHEFDTPGPLLQDTRDNKSKRARGESLLLRSKVEREMPSLKVTITPDETSQTTVLQGQTSRWKLSVSNVGYAPASNIMLKTNAPWLNMTQSNESSTDENAATSYCVGPSGTLMRVPLLNTILQPGETVEIPVAIRTSGGGRQDFYMLFRYELWSKEESDLAPRHRWARKLLSVPVYPSITMSASMMPSYSNKGEHILSVELMNYRSDRDSKLEINLNKICIASRHFEIKQLLGQIDSQDMSPPQTGNNEVSPSLKIGWQERVTLHYLVVPIETSSASVIFSTLSFAMDKNVKPESPLQLSDGAHVTDFMCRERAHDTFSSTLKAHRVEKERLLAEQEKSCQPRHVAQIRREKTSLPEQESTVSADTSVAAVHPTSLASLCPLNGGSNINVICCWSAVISNSERKDDIIYGQHHLRNLLVRPLSKTKGCPLALTATYETKVQHNFDEGPLDEEIVITIRNRLIETNVEFEFTVADQPGLDFVGTTSFNSSLSGGNELSVPIKARIYSGGVYNLQSVRLTVLKEGIGTAYLFPLQWRCVAEDSA